MVGAKLLEMGGLYLSMRLKKINLLLVFTLFSSFIIGPSLGLADSLTENLINISADEIKGEINQNIIQNENSNQMENSLEKLATRELDMNLSTLDKRSLELLDNIRESNNIVLFNEAREAYNKLHSRNLFLHDVPYKLLNKELRNSFDQISFINQHLEKRIPYLIQLQGDYEQYINTYQHTTSLSISQSLYQEKTNLLTTVIELNEPIDLDKIGSAVFKFIPKDSGKYTIYTAPYGGIGSPNYVDIAVYEDASLTEELANTEDSDYDVEYFRYSKLTLNLLSGNTYYIKFFSDSIIHNTLGITNVDMTNAYFNSKDGYSVYKGYSRLFRFTAPYTGFFSLKANMINLDQYPIDVLVCNDETTANVGGSVDYFDFELIDNGNTYEYPLALGRGQNAYLIFKTKYTKWSSFEEMITEDNSTEFSSIINLKGENGHFVFDSYSGTNEPVIFKFTPSKTGVYDIFTSEDPLFGIFDTILEISDSIPFKVPLATNDDDEGTVLSRLKPSLVAGTTYYFSVYSLSENGFSGVLNVKFLDESIDVLPPSVPKNLHVYYIDNSKAILHWDASIDNEQVASYELYKNSNFFGTTKATSYSVEVQPNQIDSFQVRSKDVAGNTSQLSNKINIYKGSYQYHYDKSGKIIYIEYASGKKTKYEYDANGNIRSIKQE